MTLGKHHELLQVKPSKRLLTYINRIGSHRVEEINVPKFVRRQFQWNKNRACTSDGRLLLERGVTLRHKYVDFKGSAVASMDLTLQDCVDPSWETVSVPGCCTFQIPPTVEIQSAETKKRWKLALPDGMVVAQPKGSNALDPIAQSRYCRIIVETAIGQAGEFNSLDDSLEPPLDLTPLNDTIEAVTRDDLAKRQGTIISWTPTAAARINGMAAAVTAYKRSIKSNAPVEVRRYDFQNSDRMHTITISWREEEASLWAQDLMKVIHSVAIVERESPAVAMAR